MPNQYRDGESWFSPMRSNVGWNGIFESGKMVVFCTMICGCERAIGLWQKDGVCLEPVGLKFLLKLRVDLSQCLFMQLMQHSLLFQCGIQFIH